MWDILLQNLPTVILVTIAAIICGAELIKAIKVWKERGKEKVNQVLEQQEKERQTRNEFELLHKKLDDMFNRFDTIDSRLDSFDKRILELERKVCDLTISDMHDIKAWIVEQYHKFYNDQGWIDAFSAETVDRRYEDYKNEGGNSYIDNLVNQIHSLSMDPAEKLKK